MKFRIFLIGTLIAVALQTTALAKIIYDRAELLRTGQEVILETGFVDPRDLFRGHYVTLNLRISTVDKKDVAVIDKFTFNDTIFIELDASGDLFAKVKLITREYPQNPSGPVIKGTARSHYSGPEQKKANLRFDFPFDRYFAPKLRAKDLEKLQRDRKLGVILVLDSEGNGAIKGITIDGKKIYEEPLF